MSLFFWLVAGLFVLALFYYLGSLLAGRQDAQGEREWDDFVAQKRAQSQRQYDADAETERLASSSSSSPI